MAASPEDIGAPDSWETADLDESMKQLMLSDSKSHFLSYSDLPETLSVTQASTSGVSSSSSSFSSVCGDNGGLAYEDTTNQVDQFLREALQNPRERISILRIEQDVEKFISDPSQDHLEFQQLPTSYLRLAAHRVAQHYSLQSTVLLDSNLPDGPGSRIIVRKASENCHPAVRLADIPMNHPSEHSVQFAIKQRPQGPHSFFNSSSHSMKSENSKSVEERKEEYNKARARIFCSGSTSVSGSSKSESSKKLLESLPCGSTPFSRMKDKSVTSGSETNFSNYVVDHSYNSRSSRNLSDELAGRYSRSNRVAIFRDRDIDRKDPDYDRNYERYVQRFDPGFGFSGGPCTIPPMYVPALNYNTEFPQLGHSHRQQVPTEHQPLPRHLPVPWPVPSSLPAIGYGHQESMIPSFNLNLDMAGACPTSSVYPNSTQYDCQSLGTPFVHPHDGVHKPFLQSHENQSEASFGFAQPR